MYCPACGSEAKSEQKFCRACGFNLQPVIPLVNEHQGTPQLSARTQRIFKKIEWLGLGIGGCGIAAIAGMAIFILLALAFVGPEARATMGPIWNKVFGVGLLLILKGAFLFTVPWLLKEFLPFKSASKSGIDIAKTKELLPESSVEPVGSITDHTTRNLEPSLQARPDRAMN